MQNNLQLIISKSLQAKAQVLLVGIRVPGNYGRRYSAMFESAFQSLATTNQIAFIPFMLEPLSGILTSENRGDYIQQDGLHPTAKAQPLILDHLYPHIQQSLNL